MEEVFHTPLVTAGSDTSLKFNTTTSASSLSQSVRVKRKVDEAGKAGKASESIQIRRGRIEPLGVPVPATYADATNVSLFKL